uniref:Uncharacterized protein n=1 Tax=Arundo donax TaxID=35708 RepID=A0A0A9AGG9_ARUDO
MNCSKEKNCQLHDINIT